MKDHKIWVTQVFDRSALQYGKKNCSYFDYFGKKLVEKVQVEPTHQVLDVATGKRAILFPLANKLGPHGKLVGIDISSKMIEETCKEAQNQQMNWIELLQMDAEQLHFPDHYFDIVFCGFALFFFPNVLKALSEFKRVLKPGGALAVTVWGEKKSELNLILQDEINKISQTNNLAVTNFENSKTIQEILQKAFFTNIQIVKENRFFPRGTLQQWWESLWSHGTRAKLEQLTPSQLSSVQENVIKKVNHLDQGIGLIEECQVFYGIAQK